MTLSKSAKIHRELERRRRRPSESLCNVPEGTGERFWNKVHKHVDGCWYWLGRYRNFETFDRSPQFRIGAGEHPPAQVAWILTHGKVGKNQNTRSKCKNRFCVNPAHHSIRHGRPKRWSGRVSMQYLQRLHRIHLRSRLTAEHMVTIYKLPFSAGSLRRYFRTLMLDELTYAQIVRWRRGLDVPRYDHPRRPGTTARRGRPAPSPPGKEGG